MNNDITLRDSATLLTTGSKIYNHLFQEIFLSLLTHITNFSLASHTYIDDCSCESNKC